MRKPLVVTALPDATRPTIVRFLEMEGFRCLEAPSGQEAVSAMTTHAVEAVVLDDDLATPDVAAVVRQIRAVPGPRQVPVVLLMNDSAAVPGAAAVLEKPFHAAALAAQLRSLLPGVEAPEG